MTSTTTPRPREDVEREIEEALGLVPGFFNAIPDEVLEDEWHLFARYELGDTLIPVKYKQLLAVAVHSETKCRYCSLLHAELAKLMGATDAEIEEAVHFAKHTVGWSVYLNGTRYSFERFEREVEKIVDYLSDRPRPTS